MEFSLMEIILITIFTLTFSLYLYLTWNYNYWKKRNVQGPKPIIIQGTFPSVINQKSHISCDFDDIYRKYKITHKFVGIYMTRIPQLMVTDPLLARSIFITNFKNFHDNEASLWIDRNREPIPGYNPFNLTGELWKEKRSEIVPALSASRIKAAYPIIEEICQKMVVYLKTLEKNSQAIGLDTKDLATRFTCEVVSNYIYGIDADAFNNDESPVLRMSKNTIQQVFRLISYFFFVSIFPLLKNLYYVRFFPKSANKFFSKILNDSIELRKQYPTERVDFLNYLLKLQEKKNLKFLDIATHTMTFFFDGFETSSIAISHCLYLLAKYENIQQKLRDEIMSVVDENGNLIMDLVQELPYLEQCLDESLRIFPPVLVLTKICTEKIEFENTDGRKLNIEVGTSVHIPVNSFHHDEQYYPDPLEYKPERFNAENGGSRKYKEMGVYYPFGDGPRICIGMKFGVAQTKAAIASIIKNFKITVNSKTRNDFKIDPKCFLCMLDGGIWLNFESIQ